MQKLFSMTSSTGVLGGGGIQNTGVSMAVTHSVFPPGYRLPPIWSRTAALSDSYIAPCAPLSTVAPAMVQDFDIYLYQQMQAGRTVSGQQHG